MPVVYVGGRYVSDDFRYALEPVVQMDYRPGIMDPIHIEGQDNLLHRVHEAMGDRRFFTPVDMYHHLKERLNGDIRVHSEMYENIMHRNN